MSAMEKTSHHQHEVFDPKHAAHLDTPACAFHYRPTGLRSDW
jgi:hypothetical protein